MGSEVPKGWEIHGMLLFNGFEYDESVGQGRRPPHLDPFPRWRRGNRALACRESGAANRRSVRSPPQSEAHSGKTSNIELPTSNSQWGIASHPVRRWGLDAERWMFCRRKICARVTDFQRYVSATPSDQSGGVLHPASNGALSDAPVCHFFPAFFFFSLINVSSPASSLALSSLVSRRHCIIGVSAPLNAFLSAYSSSPRCACSRVTAER